MKVVIQADNTQLAATRVAMGVAGLQHLIRTGKTATRLVYSDQEQLVFAMPRSETVLIVDTKRPFNFIDTNNPYTLGKPLDKIPTNLKLSDSEGDPVAYVRAGEFEARQERFSFEIMNRGFTRTSPKRVVAGCKAHPDFPRGDRVPFDRRVYPLIDGKILSMGMRTFFTTNNEIAYIADGWDIDASRFFYTVYYCDTPQPVITKMYYDAEEQEVIFTLFNGVVIALLGKEEESGDQRIWRGSTVFGTRYRSDNPDYSAYFGAPVSFTVGRLDTLNFENIAITRSGADGDVVEEFHLLGYYATVVRKESGDIVEYYMTPETPNSLGHNSLSGIHAKYISIPGVIAYNTYSYRLESFVNMNGFVTFNAKYATVGPLVTIDIDGVPALYPELLGVSTGTHSESYIPTSEHDYAVTVTDAGSRPARIRQVLDEKRQKAITHATYSAWTGGTSQSWTLYDGDMRNISAISKTSSGGELVSSLLPDALPPMWFNPLIGFTPYGSIFVGDELVFEVTRDEDGTPYDQFLHPPYGVDRSAFFENNVPIITLENSAASWPPHALYDRVAEYYLTRVITQEDIFPIQPGAVADFARRTQVVTWVGGPDGSRILVTIRVRGSDSLVSLWSMIAEGPARFASGLTDVAGVLNSVYENEPETADACVALANDVATRIAALPVEAQTQEMTQGFTALMDSTYTIIVNTFASLDFIRRMPFSGRVVPLADD